MTIDELYQLPLPEFTAARNALAKTLKGGAAKEVRALVKPTVLPWAVNQVFWHARPQYDKVLERGKALRTAQLAALKGQKADVLSATGAHRKAIAEAVKRATELAAKQNVKLDAEPLTRMFEVLSLAAAHPETPGRLTSVLQPQGFESLAGISMPDLIARPTAVPAPKAGLKPRTTTEASTKKQEEETRRAEREQQQAQADVAKATRELERAKVLESAARRDAERATFAVRRAEEALAAARKALDSL